MSDADIRKLFDQFDANKNGEITVDEFKAAIKKEHPGLNDAQVNEQVKAFLEKFDTGSGGAKKGDNIVSWAEFKGYFDAHKK